MYNFCDGDNFLNTYLTQCKFWITEMTEVIEIAASYFKRHVQKLMTSLKTRAAFNEIYVGTVEKDDDFAP